MDDPVNHYAGGGVSAEFGELLAELAAAWDTPLTEARVRVYAKALSGVRLSVLRRAFSEAVRDSARFPSVAEVLQKVRPRPEDAALLAWAGLERAAAKVGAWADLEVEDPAAAHALVTAFGSWPAFCELPDGPARALKRQEFLAAYRAFRPRGVSASVRLQGQLGGSDAGLLQLTGEVSPAEPKAMLPPAKEEE